ncbi:MAG: hypothetical protein M3252_04450 [Actinomycetota bacterium]|nr:hypothetical protein [Actinomycetota bacterium]
MTATLRRPILHHCSAFALTLAGAGRMRMGADEEVEDAGIRAPDLCVTLGGS